MLWEAVSGGCVPNSFELRDLERDYPVFLAKEQSSCWCRACCNPSQPAFVIFQNAVFKEDVLSSHLPRAIPAAPLPRCQPDRHVKELPVAACTTHDLRPGPPPFVRGTGAGSEMLRDRLRGGLQEIRDGWHHGAHSREGWLSRQPGAVLQRELLRESSPRVPGARSGVVVCVPDAAACIRLRRRPALCTASRPPLALH